jgi:hypothetical protein
MRDVFKLILSAVVAACPVHALHAQDLAPRAYIITPVHWNAVTLTYSFSDGDVLINGALPIPNGTATTHITIFTYFHSFRFLGRSANITATLPYGIAHYQGTFMDNEKKVYRSGLMDSGYRVSVNLKGGPAMSVTEYQSWKQRTILGVSLRVVAPTGQYDGTKLINNGSNRWAFKPEFGYSRRWGHWVLDGYAGAWFFTTNPEFFSHNAFFPGTQTQSQKPMASFEGHFSYDVRSRFWISLDSNFWYGGRTVLNGVENFQTLQENSRIGVTASIPVTRHQSLKFSYSDGAYVSFGGAFQNVSVAWQYSWVGRPN